MSTPAAEAAPISLRALRLKPGMFMQTQPMGGTNGARHEAQFCAAIEGKGIMVVPIGGDVVRAELRAGEGQVVRGFTGMYDFSFLSHVIAHFTHPFAYTLLAYPDQVTARKVRNALRIRTSLPATLQRTAGGDKQSATVIDLSVAGALLSSPNSLGSIGDNGRLAMTVEVDGNRNDLAVDATICHCNKADGEDSYRTGIAFKNLGRNERLVLQCFALAADQDGVI